MCLVESGAEPETLEAVQINLLQDRPQLDVEVHEYGGELLSSAALQKGKEKSSFTLSILSSLGQVSSSYTALGSNYLFLCILTKSLTMYCKSCRFKRENQSRLGYSGYTKTRAILSPPSPNDFLYQSATNHSQSPSHSLTQGRDTECPLSENANNSEFSDFFCA